MIFRIKIKLLTKICGLHKPYIIFCILLHPGFKYLSFLYHVLSVTAFIQSIRRDRQVHVAPVTRTAVSRIRPISMTLTTITTRDQ